MSGAIDAAACLGSHDMLLMTFDTLRLDVARDALARGDTPNLAALLPAGGWEHRHSPASFTFAAHQAFFAGFLPTPAIPREQDPDAHRRLFAARFPGSETTADGTLVFDAPDIVTGLAGQGYRTICIGGTGFFNKRSPLGSVLPDLFDESWWDERLGVACRDSAANQVACAVERIAAQPADRRLLVFVNLAACHPPHHFYRGEGEIDSPDSQRAALADIDRHLPALFAALRRRAPLLAILTSDHGTAFGEDGYHGHRIGHPSVWDVPYAQLLLGQERGA